MNRKRKIRLLSLLMAMVLVTTLLVFNAFAVEEQHYTVRFIIPGQAAPYEVQVVQGQKIGAENMPADPVITGFIFLGWKVQGSDPAEPVTAETVPTKDMLVVVNTEPAVTVLFANPSDGMSGTAQEMQLPLNQPIGDKLPAVPAPDGIRHFKWINTKDKAVITADTVLKEDMANALGMIIIAASPENHTEEVVTGKAATCTEAGLSDGKKCSVCNTVLEEQKEIPALGHTFDESKWESKADGHYHVCSVCGAQSKLEAHKPGPAATTTKPQTCTVCGYELAPVVEATEVPTEAPTEKPTEAPTEKPTEAPTEVPSEAPSEAPTEVPSEAPSEVPTEVPSEAPSEAPTEAPTVAPTEAPTVAPTDAPTDDPTEAPTDAPVVPTEKPSGGSNTPAAPTQAPNNPSSNSGSHAAPATADAQDFVIVFAILAAGSVMVVIGVNKKRGASR